jgi:hypothetical protein
MSGAEDGKVVRWDISTYTIRSIFNNGYDFNVQTPFLSYLRAPTRNTIYFGGIRLEPINGNNTRFYWTRDGHSEQLSTFIQWTGDVLAKSDGSVNSTGVTPFTLGTSILMGDRTISRSIDLVEGGEFQQIQYRINNTSVLNDLRLKSILASIKPSGVSMEVMT